MTVAGQGLEAWALGAEEADTMIMNRQSFVLPQLEVLLPAGPGEVLLGGAYHRAQLEQSRSESSYESSSEDTRWALGLYAGYAVALLESERGAVRAGGRLGLCVGKEKESRSYSYDGNGDTDDESEEIDDKPLFVTAFLSGEYLVWEHFGLQVEGGLSYFGYTVGDSDDERKSSWITTYTALSGGVRF